MIKSEELLAILKEVDSSQRMPETTLAVLKAKLWDLHERSEEQDRKTQREAVARRSGGMEIG